MKLKQNISAFGNVHDSSENCCNESFAIALPNMYPCKEREPFINNKENTVISPSFPGDV